MIQDSMGESSQLVFRRKSVAGKWPKHDCQGRTRTPLLYVALKQGLDASRSVVWLHCFCGRLGELSTDSTNRLTLDPCPGEFYTHRQTVIGLFSLSARARDSTAIPPKHRTKGASCSRANHRAASRKLHLVQIDCNLFNPRLSKGGE